MAVRVFCLGRGGEVGNLYYLQPLHLMLHSQLCQLLLRTLCQECQGDIFVPRLSVLGGSITDMLAWVTDVQLLINRT